MSDNGEANTDLKRNKVGRKVKGTKNRRLKLFSLVFRKTKKPVGETVKALKRETFQVSEEEKKRISKKLSLKSINSLSTGSTGRDTEHYDGEQIFMLKNKRPASVVEQVFKNLPFGEYKPEAGELYSDLVHDLLQDLTRVPTGNYMLQTFRRLAVLLEDSQEDLDEAIRKEQENLEPEITLAATAFKAVLATTWYLEELHENKMFTPTEDNHRLAFVLLLIHTASYLDDISQVNSPGAFEHISGIKLDDSMIIAQQALAVILYNLPRSFDKEGFQKMLARFLEECEDK